MKEQNNINILWRKFDLLFCREKSKTFLYLLTKNSWKVAKYKM